MKGIFTSKLAILPAFVALTILAGCGGTIASPTPTVTQPTATSVEEKPTATSGSSGQQMDGWQTITSDEGGFSVSMPGKPIEEARDRDAAAGLFAEHSYKVSNKDATYLLSYTDFPESMHNPPDELLKYYGIVSSGDTVVQDEQVTVQGNPGRVVELDALGGTYIWYKAVIVGKRLYALSVSAPTTSKEAIAGDAQHFQESFRLLSP